MKIGFTGTQTGLSPDQRGTLYVYAATCSIKDEFHHGDCIGADAEAHDIFGLMDVPIVIHPPVNEAKRAFRKGTVLPAKDYLARNHDIVDACDVLIACPSGKEKLRSGTWATIRYARKIGKPVRIIEP